MAEPDVNLGSVGFGLDANTEPLERSLAALEKFGDKVDQIGNRTDETAQKLYSRFTQVEKSLTQMFPKIEATTEALRKAGASTRHVDEITSSYSRLAQTLEKTRNMSQLGQHEINRGIVGMNAIISRGARAAKEQADQNRLATQQADALFRAQQRVADLTERFRLRGAPVDFADNARAALDRYQQALSKGTLSTQELRRNTRIFTADVSALSREFRNYVNVATEANRIQRQLSQATRMVNAINLQAQRLGINPSFGRANTGALADLQTALLGGDITRVITAQNRLQSVVARTREEMFRAQQQGFSFASTFHTLSRATILAAGPLSGIGARMAVLAALFESGTAKAALFVAGATGAFAGFGFIAAGAIKASMEMERFDAILTSATGSVALNAQEFQYVREQADRFGVSIRGLVEPYAKFGTAARLAGFSLDQQRNIFEAIITAGTALRFDTQKTERAFLSIEQMVSKNTVQMQELKLQLGQVIPGAVEIAAIAMGKTTAELFKMMEAGELLARDFLPRLAETLKTLFGPGALEGAKSLQAELGRLSTLVFEVQLAFDRATNSSAIFRNIVILLQDTLRSLAQNMDQVLAIMAAIAGMLGGGILAMGLLALGRTVVSVTGAFVGLWNAFAKLSAGAAAFATALGGPLAILARVALVVAGAVAGYKLFNQETDIFSANIDDFLRKSDQWIQSTEEIGFAHKRTAEQMKKATLSHITDVSGELEMVMMQIQAQKELQAAREAASTPRRRNVTPQTLMRDMTGKSKSEVKQEETEEMKALKQRQANLQEMLNRLNALHEKISGIKTRDFDLSGNLDKGSKSWESWLDQIRNAIHETEKWDEKLAAVGQPDSQGIMDVAEAFEKADKLIEKIPTKGSEMNKAIQALKDAGFWVDNLRQSLANMFLHSQNAETQFREATDRIREQAKSSEDLLKIWVKLRDENEALTGALAGVDPEGARRSKQWEELETSLRRIYGNLIDDQETVNQLVAQFKELWDENTGLQKTVDQTKALRRELDRMADSFGSKTDKAWRQFFENQERIDKGVKAGLITEATAKEFREKNSSELYQKLLQDANAWTKKTIELIGRVEDAAAETFADWATGGETSFRDMLRNMEREMIAFVTKMLVLRPIMESLFGGLATGNFRPAAGGGGVDMGLIGNFLMKSLPMLPTQIPHGGGSGGGAALIGDFMMESLSILPTQIAHGGGSVGIGPVRYIPKSTFTDAPRMHSGGEVLGPDEVPIVAKRGERVLTREQQRDQTGTGGRRLVINMPVNITTADARSFRASRGQIMSDLHVTASNAFRRFK